MGSADRTRPHPPLIRFQATERITATPRRLPSGPYWFGRQFVLGPVRPAGITPWTFTTQGRFATS